MANRVRQEVEIHSRLKHRSVLELYTFFQDANYVYLVLELAHNGELQRYMKQTMRRPMTEPEAAAILQQVVAGLLYLHSHNIMHRDISLSNVLLSKDMHIKIADFGLATQLKQPNERHVTMCGTPNFISPEVVSRASHGLPADVWGLGCMLFTLLVGHPPFDTDAVQATLNRVVMSDYHIPSCVSYEAKDLIEKLLKKNPDERISLEQVLQHPFMTRFNTAWSGNGSSSTNQKENRVLHDNRTISSCDSGIITFASSKYFLSNNAHSRSNLILKSLGTASSSCKPFTQPYGVESVVSDLLYTEAYDNKYLDGIVLPNQLERQADNQKQQQVNLYAEGNHCDWMVTDSTTSQPYSERGKNFASNDMSTPRQHMLPVHPRVNCNEATPKSQANCILTPEHISVPPLNTARLQPTRYKTKSAIMSILKHGEVVIEFIKYRSKYNADRVTDVCWISGDGKRIVVYHSDSGRGLAIGEHAPEMPAGISPNCIFSYDNLPPKHWKKYVYAARFVSLVKSKTPKITYFSSQAKCALMESLEDFECCFYDGSKVTVCSNDVVKAYDVHGRQLNIDAEYQIAKPLIDHQKTCFDHCTSLNKALELTAASSSHSCFPVVIGRRPNSDIQSELLTTHKRGNTNVPIHSSTPKYQGGGSSINFSLSGTSSAVYDSTIHRPHRPHRSNHQLIASQQNVPIKRVNVPGVGVATEVMTTSLW